MKKLCLFLFPISLFFSIMGFYPGKLFVTGASGAYKDPFLLIAQGQSLLQEGDLVVRLNRDPTSQYIRNFNRHDKNFSHAGIVLFEDGYPYVFHVVNGVENPDEKLRMDSLSHFSNPRKNMSYAIYRYSLTASEIRLLKDQIHQWYHQGVRFDSVFNLKTDDRMYCSEMVSKALYKATCKRITIGTTPLTVMEAKLFSVHMHLSFAYTSTLQLVAMDNLYVNPYCHLIKEYHF